MIKYNKIPNVFKRDTETNKLIEGEAISKEVDYLCCLTWVCTEKIDGTNIGIVWDGYRISYQGRTEKAQIPKHLLEKLEQLFGAKEEIFEQMFGEKQVILFGEGFGYKIQNGGDYLGKEVDFILFDVYMPDEDIWLERDSIVDIADKLKIRVVPIVFKGSLPQAINYIKTMPESTIGKAKMEGIVAKPFIEMRDRRGNRIMVKIKCRDWKGEQE